MDNKRWLYLGAWLDFRGKDNIWLARKTGINKGQISRYVTNDFKKKPRPSNMLLMANALNIGVEQLWMDPFLFVDKQAASQPYDLQNWLDDPMATIDGKLATQKEKENLRKLFDFIVERKEGE